MVITRVSTKKKKKKKGEPSWSLKLMCGKERERTFGSPFKTPLDEHKLVEIRNEKGIKNRGPFKLR
jgi:hypothetical protein